VLNISKCIRVYPVGYEKINVVGKVLLKAGRALILWTENIKHKGEVFSGEWARDS
jgi:hypothetical protein